MLACEYPRDLLELIVVDNLPSDSAARDGIEARYDGERRISYMRCDRPGAAAARNAGAARATGEILAVIDDDAVADRWWLAELVRGFRAGPAVGCVTGLVVPRELETYAQRLFEAMGGFNKGFERRVYDEGTNRPPEPLFPFNGAMFGSGNNVAYRRSALADLGYYDSALGPGTLSTSGEDLELFTRIILSGHALAYEPGAIVLHDHRREMEELKRQAHDYGMGITAALTSTVLRRPATLWEIARRVPYGAYFLLSRHSPRDRWHGVACPRELRRAQLRGIARGPAGYLAARRWRS